jgi:hypothetical protein
LSQPKQLPQDMQRRASNSAVDSSRPPVTSSKVVIRRREPLPRSGQAG